VIRAVLFDLYDTLGYLNSSIIQEGRRELARLAGVDPDAWAAEWRATAMERMLGTLGDMEAQIGLMLRRLDGDPTPELVANLAARENLAWEGAVTLYPDALPVLGELRRRGFTLGLISNCSCQAGAVVRMLGLDALMDTVVLSCDVGVAKPDPAIFRHACDALGVEPTACMFVADGAFTELDAAKSLGMVAVKIEQPNQSGDYGTSTQFDHRITRLWQVLELVGPAPA
jgi:putative hydrolase of the HAD superfamily